MNDASATRGNEYGTPDRWFVLCLLAVNYFMLYLHRNLLNYLQPPLKAELGLTDMQLGLLHWAFLLSYALAQIGAGYLGDRYRRRTVLLTSLFVSSLTLVVTGWAQDFSQLLLLRVLLAVTQSASVPAIASIMGDCFTARNRSKAVSVYLLSSPISLVVAGWLGGMIADSSSWRMTFFVFGGIGGAVWCLVFLLLREPERSDRVDEAGLGTQGAPLLATLKSVLSIPSYLTMALAYVLVSNVIEITKFWLPRYFYDAFDMNLEGAGLMATIYINAGMVLGLIAGGVWADRWARRAMSGRFGVQLIGMVVCVPALAIMGTSQSRIVLAAVMFLFGAGMGLYLTNLWTTTFDVVDPAARATAVGLLNVATGVLGAWISPFVGYLQDKGIVENLGSIFLSMSALAAVAVLLLGLIIRFFLSNDYRGNLASPPDR